MAPWSYEHVTIAPGLRLADDVFDPMKHYSVKGKKRSVVPKRFGERSRLMAG